MGRGFSVVVYTDYSGKSDQISHYAIKRYRNGKEVLHDYGFKPVSPYLKSTEGELEAALEAMRLFPGAEIMTDCEHVIRELGHFAPVKHVRAHCGNVGNENADYLARNSQLHPVYWNRHF